MAEAAKTNETDSLPRPGLVNEVCREWLVKEDGALAYHLQSQEIKEHYTGNKSRNALVRQDFPHALDEQRREEEEATALRMLYVQMVNQQEKIDAQLAKQLAEKIEQEEIEKRHALEEGDQEIARKLQEHERLNSKKKKKSEMGIDIQRDANDIQHLQYDHSMNDVGLPCPSLYNQEMLAQQFRLCTLTDVAIQTNNLKLPDNSNLEDAPSPPAISEDEARKLQEEQDEEFARLLQEEEGTEEINMLNQDRLLAIEVQDKELARLLQEREKVRAKRARERAKQKAMLKKQQQLPSDSDDLVTSSLQNNHQSSEWTEPAAGNTAIRPTLLNLTSGSNKPVIDNSKQSITDVEISDSYKSLESSPSHAALPNIAMAIDPTYCRRTVHDQNNSCTSPVLNVPSNISSPAVSLPPPEFDEEDNLVPPYMPIQGQRRSASLEKKHKKGRNKESCKQQ